MKRLRGLTAMALVAGVASMPSSYGAPAGARCDYVAFSPAFALDGDAMCVHVVRDAGEDLFYPVEQYVVYVTGDGGRSWRQAAARGMDPNLEAGRVTQVVFSATYPRDRHVYVELAGRGMFVTTDFGATFTALSSAANFPGADSLARFTMTVGTGEQRRELPALANGYEGGMCQLVPTTRKPLACTSFPYIWVEREMTPVAGGQHFTTRFLVPPDYPAQPPLAFVARFDSDLSDDKGDHLLECDAAFVCTKTVYSWDKGIDVHRFWMSPSYTTDRTVVVEAFSGLDILFFKSTDGGRSWQRWRAAEKLVAAAGRSADRLSWSMAFSPEQPRTMWLRISTARPRSYNATGPTQAPASVADQVFRSADGGGRWTRVAFGAGFGRRARGATIPWTASPDEARGYAGSGIFAPGGPSLFALGQLDSAWRTEYAGIWCSRDQGRTWAKTCPR